MTDVASKLAHWPRLSFGVHGRDGEQFIARLIDSMPAQEDVTIEVVICNNESSDGTAPVSEAFARAAARTLARGPDRPPQSGDGSAAQPASTAPRSGCEAP